MDAETEILIRSHEELNALLKRGLDSGIPPREFNRASPTAKRPCAACGLKREFPGAPDPCLGYLPGVENACCGHGVQCGYIQFENGITVRGVFHTQHGPGPGNNTNGNP